MHVAELPELVEQVREHPYPLLFATISGAHIYGFPSHNSDFDLRGAHVLPLDEVLGLQIRHETIEKESIYMFTEGSIFKKSEEVDGKGNIDLKPRQLPDNMKPTHPVYR
ncbi:MAG: DNA polymerase beta superfamily protein, partial [Planctomycetota bacterium]